MYYIIKNRKNLPFWKNILTEKRKRSEKIVDKEKKYMLSYCKSKR